MEYHAVCMGESMKVNSTKITDLNYFWKSIKIYSLINSLPYGNARATVTCLQ